MRDIISGLQPSLFALTGIGTLFFTSYPKQVKKWKEQPSDPLKLKPLRILQSSLFLLVFASIFSIIFSPSAKYAVINFVIICILYVIYGAIVFGGLKKYSKHS